MSEGLSCSVKQFIIYCRLLSRWAEPILFQKFQTGEQSQSVYFCPKLRVYVYPIGGLNRAESRRSASAANKPIHLPDFSQLRESDSFGVSSLNHIGIIILSFISQNCLILRTTMAV